MTSFIRIGAEEFNDYLREDGLDNALQWRLEHGQEHRPGREFYRRCAKTLVQVGAASEGDSTHALDTGLPLKRITGRNPYVGTGPGDLRFSVSFRHKPLVNAFSSVHMERVSPGQKADWQSHWASNTFGFD